jgi:hypothetical protein
MRIYRLSQAEFRTWRDHAARAELAKQIFAKHGVAQVRAPSGHILGTARQNGQRVPIEKSRTRPAHHVVRPGECMCREWQKPAGKEHEHHPICINKSAWESQQRHDPDAPRDRVVVSPTAAHEPAVQAEPAPAAAPAVAKEEEAGREHRDTDPAPPPVEPAPAVAEVPPAPKAPTATAAPGPEGCVCQDWAGVVAGQHHPLCQFKSAWEREHHVPVAQLVELETGTVVREASPEEAEASKQKEPEDGVGAIELSDGKLYYVRTE